MQKRNPKSEKEKERGGLTRERKESKESKNKRGGAESEKERKSEMRKSNKNRFLGFK